ncbi:hypothetical protein Tco_0333726, partial [Tanacetum coccineum]
NVFSDLDEAFEYAKQVSIEETEQRELKRRTKRRHARIMLERQVNKEKQGKESKKQAILEEIKRTNIGEGSSAAPESLGHSSSFYDSSESATDDKTESKSTSDHDESNNDFKNEDENDKSTSNEESIESISLIMMMIRQKIL